MSEFFRVYAPKDSMLLWDPYIAFRYSPQVTTDTGTHCPKVMISVGRRVKDKIDKDRLRVLPNKVKEEIAKKYTLETLARPNISIRDKLINHLVRINQNLQLKLLGISFTRTEDDFEVYQFLKFTKPEELLEIGFGFGLALKELGATPGQVRNFMNNVLKSYEKNNPKAMVMK